MKAATKDMIYLAAMFAGMFCMETARAQVVREPLGPLECFEIADAEGLADSSSLQLCAGAISAAPGQCYAIADNENDLSTPQILNLCTNATSTEPNACFEELQTNGTLTNEQMIDYCATRCPIGPAPAEVSNANCLAVALEVTTLTQQMAERLCVRSITTAPVECFTEGEDTAALTTEQLVDLCAEGRSCQYVTAVSSAY
jgi:hypothetical protein